MRIESGGPLFTLFLLLGACDGPADKPDDSGTSEGYHPAGWSAPTEHGRAAKHQDQVGADCHGTELTGSGAAVSCDTCHTGATGTRRLPSG